MRMKLIFIDVSVMFLNEIFKCETELTKLHNTLKWFDMSAQSQKKLRA